MFLFLLIAMVVVVGAVTLAVLAGGDSAALPEAAPERLVDPLPANRPVGRADVEALRLPVALRGYRMADVDDALARLGAELAERDARIAELESVPAGARAVEPGGRELFADADFAGPDRGTAFADAGPAFADADPDLDPGSEPASEPEPEPGRDRETVRDAVPDGAGEDRGADSAVRPAETSGVPSDARPGEAGTGGRDR